MRLLHLVRHGRTAWNVEHRVMGWRDEGIEPASHPHAEAVAAALAADGVEEIVTSPLRRARETAAPLARAVGREPRPDPRVGELHVGTAWEGLTEEDIAARWPDDWRTWRAEPHALDRPGRETLPALYARVGEVLDELAAAPATGPAVIVTHDAVVRAAVAWALGVGPESYLRIEVANCSLTTVRVGDGLRRLVRANEVAHLERPRPG